jgi:uncharacterized protein (DUF1697 family)
MLRGVNLGASRRMKMDDLRAVYESLGLTGVRTYVQSGNVVFRAPRAITAKRIEDAIEKRFGFRSTVVLRTPEELQDVVARNPFQEFEPSKLLVWFMVDDPGEAARVRVRALDAPPEKLYADGRELYIYFPNGQARPTLNMTAVGKAIGGDGTGRNWNTVTKLLEIAGSL